MFVIPTRSFGLIGPKMSENVQKKNCHIFNGPGKGAGCRQRRFCMFFYQPKHRKRKKVAKMWLISLINAHEMWKTCSAGKLTPLLNEKGLIK